MADRIITFDDFSRGEYGSMNELEAPKGSITGKNVVRYTDGAVGPRNGDKEFVLTNIPASPIVGMGWHVKGPGGAPGAGFRVWLIQQIATARRFMVLDQNALNIDPSVSQAAATYAGTVPTGSLYPIGREIEWGAYSFFNYPERTPGLSYFNSFTESFVDVAGAPRGHHLAGHKERLYIAGWDGAIGYRVRYSAAVNGGSWPALNYFDVGDEYLTRGLASLRGRLVIMKESSPQGHWWTMSGIPGYNEVLHQPTIAPYAIPTQQIAVVGEEIWFSGLAGHGLGKYVVGSFDGAKVKMHTHLEISDSPPAIPTPFYPRFLWNAIPLSNPGDVVILSDGQSTKDRRMFLRRSEAWWKHTRKLGGGFAASETILGIVVHAESSPTGVPRFFRFDPYNDRPPFPSDLNTVPLDPEDPDTPVEFAIPASFADKNEDWTVRAVTVDFKKWNTGDSNPNRFRVSAQGAGRFNADDGAWRTQEWSEAPSKAAVDGTLSRQHFAFENDWAGGFRIKFSGMRGVAIKRFHVFVEARPAPGAR